MQQGIDLMLYGMGTVAVFLALLVISTVLMSKVVQRYFADDEEPATPARAADTGQEVVDARLLQIIKSAIDQHRAKRR